MLSIILLFIAVAALLNALLFGGSFVFSVIAAAIAFAAFAVRMIKPLGSSGIKTIIGIAALIAAVVVGSFGTLKLHDGGILKYWDYVDRIEAQISAEDVSAAEYILSELEKEYGNSVNSGIEKAKTQILREEYDKARSTLNSLGSQYRHLRDYYLLMSYIYIQTSDSVNAEALMTEAAQFYPDWTSMQYYAGSTALSNGHIEKGTFFALRAVEQSSGANPEYLLEAGRGCYLAGDYENALTYLNEALDICDDEETRSSIEWFLNVIRTEEAA